MKAEIINQPYSGEYNERIYDIESPWNSQSWTWIKFTNERGSESVGQFRGEPRAVKVSDKRDEIMVLTSDYIFRLNRNNLSIIETESQPEYEDLEISPKGIFIFQGFTEIFKLNNSLSQMKIVESPFEMDLIKFKNWNGDILEFECDELGNYSRHEVMELDTVEWTIKIKKRTTTKN